MIQIKVYDLIGFLIAFLNVHRDLLSKWNILKICVFNRFGIVHSSSKKTVKKGSVSISISSKLQKI